MPANAETILRYALIFLAGYLGKRGVLPEELQGPFVDLLVALIPALIVAAWGLYEQRGKRLVERAAEVPGVKVIAATAALADGIPSDKVVTASVAAERLNT